MRIKVSGSVLHCLLPFAALLILAAPLAFAAAQTRTNPPSWGKRVRYAEQNSAELNE